MAKPCETFSLAHFLPKLFMSAHDLKWQVGNLKCSSCANPFLHDKIQNKTKFASDQLDPLYSVQQCADTL